MSIKKLEQLCIAKVLGNFYESNDVLSIYDLGDKICTDMIETLFERMLIYPTCVDRLQVEGIDSLRILAIATLFHHERPSQWLADIVAAGLENLKISCVNFDEWVAKAIVERYQPPPTCRKRICCWLTASYNNEEQIAPTPIVALHTLKICEFDAYSTVQYLPCLLSIFTDTLKCLQIQYKANYVNGFNDLREIDGQQLFEAIGNLSLDKLSLQNLDLMDTISFEASSSLQSLNTLEIRKMCSMYDEHILSFITVAGQSIQHLCIDTILGITDATLQNIQLYCTNLVTLELAHTHNIMLLLKKQQLFTSTGLLQFFATANLTKLQRLSLRMIDTILIDTVLDDVFVNFITSTQLEYIEIYKCDRLTKRTLQILANIPSLKYLKIEDCNWIEDHELQAFMTHHGLKEWNNETLWSDLMQ